MQLYALKYIKYTYFSTNICKKELILIKTQFYTSLNQYFKLLY